MRFLQFICLSKPEDTCVATVGVGEKKCDPMQHTGIYISSGLKKKDHEMKALPQATTDR